MTKYAEKCHLLNGFEVDSLLLIDFSKKKLR